MLQTGAVPPPSGSHGAAEGDRGASSGPPPGQCATVSGQHPVHAARTRPLCAPGHRHPVGTDSHGTRPKL